jgi:hypothetical protein
VLPCSLAQGHVESRRHGIGDVSLDLEHVGQRGVERLLPPCDAAAGIDQFRADPQRFATPARLSHRTVPVSMFELSSDTVLNFSLAPSPG